MSWTSDDELIAELLRLSRRMRLQAGRGPSAAELAGCLHLPLAEVRAALAQAKDRAACVIADDGKAHGAQVPAGLIEAFTPAEEKLLLRQLGVDMELMSLKTPTGATDWINPRKTVSEAPPPYEGEVAEQASKIRIPLHMVKTIKKLARTSREISREIGREPTSEELAHRLHMPPEKVRKVLKLAKQPISPDTPVGGADTKAVLPLDAAIQANLRETTKRVLASLTPREREFLTKRFGLDVKSDNTLEKAGQKFSVTRERIRRIEAKALRKLKRGRSERHAYAFRTVGADDLTLIRDWLGRPHVACWWSDPDEQIAELRRNPFDRGFDAYVMLLDDRPVGYLQCYDASPGAEVTVLMQPPGTRGIDLFIGEAWALGQGHGSAFLRRFTNRLLALPGVRRVIADPVVTNARSIRCFEKAGFRRDDKVWFPWGPAVLMFCEKNQKA